MPDFEIAAKSGPSGLLVTLAVISLLLLIAVLVMFVVILFWINSFAKTIQKEIEGVKNQLGGVPAFITMATNELTAVKSLLCGYLGCKGDEKTGPCFLFGCPKPPTT